MGEEEKAWMEAHKRLQQSGEIPLVPAPAEELKRPGISAPEGAASLPEVELTEEERLGKVELLKQRRKVAVEIKESEASYVEGLMIMIKLYLTPLRKMTKLSQYKDPSATKTWRKNIISQAQYDVLASNLEVPTCTRSHISPFSGTQNVERTVCQRSQDAS